MRSDGYQDAVRVGGGGHLGADGKATDPYGRRWVIQCKHRRKGLAGSAVGTPDLQVLNGTARQVHGADVAVMVTNGRVTAPFPSPGRPQHPRSVGIRLTASVGAAARRPSTPESAMCNVVRALLGSPFPACAHTSFGRPVTAVRHLEVRSRPHIDHLGPSLALRRTRRSWPRRRQSEPRRPGSGSRPRRLRTDPAHGYARASDDSAHQYLHRRLPDGARSVMSGMMTVR